MEINLGDLGISPAMLRKFQENYATGIAAPKKVKKAKKAKTKNLLAENAVSLLAVEVLMLKRLSL